MIEWHKSDMRDMLDAAAAYNLATHGRADLLTALSTARAASAGVGTMLRNLGK